MVDDNLKDRRFKYFVAKGVSIKESDDGVKSIVVPIQSTMQDRDGDTIIDKGQDRIVEYLNSGQVPAFPNHGFGEQMAMYAFQDIMGKWVSGYIKGDVTYGELVLREGNNSAEHLKDLVEQDMPLGFSIGFAIKEYVEDENGGLTISDLELLEVSPVGIPSNARAVYSNSSQVTMAKSAVKAIEDGGRYEDIKNAINTTGDNMENENNNLKEPSEDQNPSEDAQTTQEQNVQNTGVVDSTDSQNVSKDADAQGEESSNQSKDDGSKGNDGDDDDDSDDKKEIESLKERLASLENDFKELKEALAEQNSDANADSNDDDSGKNHNPEPKTIKTVEQHGEKDFNIVDDIIVGYERKF